MVSERWKKLCNEVIARLVPKREYEGLYRKDWIHAIYNICMEIDSRPSMRESEGIFKYLKYYGFFAPPLWGNKKKLNFRVSKSETIKRKEWGEVHYDVEVTHFRLPWHRQGETPGEKKERDHYAYKQQATPEGISPTIVKLTSGQKRAAEQFSKKGTHVCQRCGSVIAGKGRHGKQRRGHTQEVCDWFMAKNIMKS